MDVAAFVISTCSFAISTILSIWAIFFNKRINDINLDSDMLKGIVGEFLIDKFPKAYSDLCINNNKLTNIDQMQDVLTALVRKLKYFKFKDSGFYKSIKTVCQELENYLVEKYLETMELDEQAEFSTNVSKQISAIYQLIDDKYKNG